MPDQTIEQRIDEALLMYRWDTQTVNEDLVLQQYPEKVMQAHDTLLDEAKQSHKELIDEARIDAIYSMHDSIMRGELQWGDIREDAWLNGTIHKWIDRVIESGDTTSTSHNGIWIQNQLTPKENNQ